MIPREQAKGIFTQVLIALYSQMTPKSSFLMSFFQPETTDAKAVSIEVERNNEMISVDVIRGASGTRNEFGKSTEKIWIPPFHNEWFDNTSLQRYDRVFGSEPNATPRTIGYLGTEVASKYEKIEEKINRAKELQCASVLNTGVVSLKNGDNIDFLRQAGSMVDLTGAYWTDTAAPIENQLIAGGNWVRQKARIGAGDFHLILPGEGWVNLSNSDYFKTKANFQNVQLLDITFPQAGIGGSVFHGRIVAGTFTFYVWSYDEVYDTKTVKANRYWPADKAVIIPRAGSKLVMAHAGVPAIMADQSNAEFAQFIAQVEAMFYRFNYIDTARKAHIFESYSAPLAVPVTVDAIYTMKIKA